MSDVLRAPVAFGVEANLSSAMGLITLSDNHGNSTRGQTLTCAHEQPITMSNAQWDRLHAEINRHPFETFNLRGVTSSLGDMESPLRTMCRKIDADIHRLK